MIDAYSVEEERDKEECGMRNGGEEDNCKLREMIILSIWFILKEIGLKTYANVKCPKRQLFHMIGLNTIREQHTLCCFPKKQSKSAILTWL